MKKLSLDLKILIISYCCYGYIRKRKESILLSNFDE